MRVAVVIAVHAIDVLAPALDRLADGADEDHAQDREENHEIEQLNPRGPVE